MTPQHGESIVEEHSTKTAGHSADSAPASRTYRARPRRTTFTVTVVDAENDRPSGFGLTLDEVINEWAGTLRGCLRSARDEGEPDDLFDDVCIWGDGNRVLAVLRVDPVGRRVEVVRFDGA